MVKSWLVRWNYVKYRYADYAFTSNKNAVNALDGLLSMVHDTTISHLDTRSNAAHTIVKQNFRLFLIVAPARGPESRAQPISIIRNISTTIRVDEYHVPLGSVCIALSTVYCVFAAALSYTTHVPPRPFNILVGSLPSSSCRVLEACHFCFMQ